MKKLGVLAAFMMVASMAFSSGILTNTNQSAQFIRMLSRNASLGIDGVYYNPAGLIKLDDGWHFSVNSQTIWQTRSIDSKFPLLNDGYYEGDVFVPSFPTLFAAYKMDKWALSFGFGPNAGGGTANFDRGLPSFEIPISKVVPALAPLTQIDPSLAVSGYDADLTLNGSSMFLGFQIGATYEVSDMLSLSAGVRYMPAINKYTGSIRDIQLKVAGEYYDAPEWLTGAAGAVSGYASQASAGADLLYNTASSMQPIIDGGGGVYTLAQLEGAGVIDATQRAQIEGGLMQIGIPQEQINVMNMSQVQGTYNTAGDQYTQTAAVLTGTAQSLNGTASQLGDKEVETKQTGAGFTPILGLNFSPNENVNIAVRYEHKTYLTVENSTKVDDLGLFPDGEISRSDVPGILGIGFGYTDNDWFEVQFSYNYYFDKNVDWGGNIRDIAIWKDRDPSKIRAREIENNTFDVALGVQFNATKKFSISAGAMYQKVGVADSYNSDFDYSPDSNLAIGGGIMWKLTDQLTLDAGFIDVLYKEAQVSYFDPDLNTNYNETYDKKSMSFALGLSYSLPFE